MEEEEEEEEERGAPSPMLPTPKGETPREKRSSGVGPCGAFLLLLLLGQLGGDGYKEKSLVRQAGRRDAHTQQAPLSPSP